MLTLDCGRTLPAYLRLIVLGATVGCGGLLASEPTGADATTDGARAEGGSESTSAADGARAEGGSESTSAAADANEERADGAVGDSGASFDAVEDVQPACPMSCSSSSSFVVQWSGGCDCEACGSDAGPPPLPLGDFFFCAKIACQQHGTQCSESEDLTGVVKVTCVRCDSFSDGG
jgi:hypothetical protein